MIDVKVYTSSNVTVVPTPPMMLIDENQSVNLIEFNCPPAANLFPTGIQIQANGNLRMRQSSISVSGEEAGQYCIVHQSSATTEASNCFFGSGHHTFGVYSGTVNIYECELAGGVDAFSGIVKHVNTYHDGPFVVSGGAEVWVTGMKWPEHEDNFSVWFELTGAGTKVIVSNSKATVVVPPYSVVSVEEGTTFKAFNSEFTNTYVYADGTKGDTISGPSTVNVYLYYCTLSVPSSGPTVIGSVPPIVSAD